MKINRVSKMYQSTQLIESLLQKGVKQLSTSSKTPRLDAEVLLSHSLNQPRSYLFAWPEKKISDELCQQYHTYLNRREKGEPIAYILGEKEFWSLQFLVNEYTLIPRPETELLVEKTLNCLSNDENHLVADLGTGCGAVALALAHERSKWKIVATDVSEKALLVAKLNAKRLQLKNVSFSKGDWFEALNQTGFSALISNPPYICPDDPEVSHHVREFEPELALFSNEVGLAEIKKIITIAPAYLTSRGYLLLEHGHRQAEQVRNLLKLEGFCQIETFQDLAGMSRVSLGMKK